VAPGIASCPHCHTLFRVTPAQLHAAAGRVRCGVCLHAFQAGAPPAGPAADAATAPEPERPDEGGVQVWQPPVELPPADPAPLFHVLDAESAPPGPVALDSVLPPLELTSPPRPRRRRALALLTLVAALALAGQYLLHNFEQLAAGPQRPWLERACSLLGCTLPPYSAPEQVRTEGLVVRSHPRHDRALQVQATILSQARHPQPWPRLRLTFSDWQGQVVASRSFAVDDYLAGEPHRPPGMPPRRPVRIGLELVDPGPEAVNYELRVEPARRP